MSKVKLALGASLGGTGLENTDYDLTGFTSRMASMLAWWREAWLQADAHNAAGLSIGLAMMFIHMHSMRRNVGMVVHVLKYGHERQEEMAAQISNAIRLADRLKWITVAGDDEEAEFAQLTRDRREASRIIDALQKALGDAGT